MIAQYMPAFIARFVIPSTVLLLLGVSLRATEVDFWRPYAGPDDATYLLATFDDDAAPVGTAKVEHTERIGTPARASGKFGQALQLGGHSGLNRWSSPCT